MKRPPAYHYPPITSEDWRLHWAHLRFMLKIMPMAALAGGLIGYLLGLIFVR